MMEYGGLDIPAEIIEGIIAKVDDGSPNSIHALKFCSLASTSFRAPCQRRLFSTITFTTGNIRLLPKLLHIFLANPDLPSRVRAFKLKVDASNFHINEISGWFTQNNSLPDILNMLPNVRIFQLGLKLSGALRWNQLSESLKAAIQRVCHSTNLHTLDLCCLLSPPVNLITENPSIKHLILKDVHVDEAQDLSDCRLQLESFELVHSPVLARQLLGLKVVTRKETHSVFSRLRTFKTSLSDGDDVAIARELLQDVPSIEIFHCTNRNQKLPATLTCSINLSRMASLKSLTYLFTVSPTFHIPFDAGLSGLSAILQSPTPLDLEEITIGISWTYCSVGSERQHLSHNKNGWSEVDGILTGSNLPKLRKVVLKIAMVHYIWLDKAHSLSDPAAAREIRGLILEMNLFPLVASSKSIFLEIVTVADRGM